MPPHEFENRAVAQALFEVICFAMKILRARNFDAENFVYEQTRGGRARTALLRKTLFVL